MKLIQHLSDEVWCTMWDTKESYAWKYHQKVKDTLGSGSRASQSQGLRPKKKHNLSVDQMLDMVGKKYREKTKMGCFFFMDFENDKYYTTWHTTKNTQQTLGERAQGAPLPAPCPI